jgi:hypothetical protein
LGWGILDPIDRTHLHHFNGSQIGNFVYLESRP